MVNCFALLQILRRALALVLVPLLLPLLGCEPPRFMPHLTEVQPSPQQNDNRKKLNIETDVVHVPLASDPDVSDASVGEAPVSTVTSGGEEPLSAEDMLKLMAESERAAIAVTDLNVPPPGIVTPITRVEERPMVAPGDGGDEFPGVGSATSIVALLVPLTGRDSELGQAMLNAAQLALFDNLDLATTLLIKDTTGTPEGAANAASEALEEGAQLLIGPLFSESIRAAAPASRERGVAIIGFSNDRAVAGEGVYVFGFTPDQQIKRIVTYAAASGVRRVAALVPHNDYGHAVVAALDESVQGAGLSVGQIEYFATDGSDAEEVVQRMAGLYKSSDSPSQQPIDGVLIAAGGRQLRSLASFLSFDIETTRVRLLGTELWHHENIPGEPALKGGWFAAPPPGKWARFEQKYQVSFDSQPPHGAALAYDAISLAGMLIRTRQIDSVHSTEAGALSATNGFAGIQGVFRFGLDGVAERALAIYEVSADGFKVIDPPRPGFDGGPMQ